MGENRDRPFGMPNDACCNLPAIFWYLFNDDRFIFKILLMSLMIAVHLEGGNCNVNSSPSNSQPRISFLWHQVPSPLCNFFSAMGSPPLCVVTSGGGNMECIPLIIALDIFVRCSCSSLLVAEMKSSTKTSNAVVSFEFDSFVFVAIFGLFNIMSSNRCLGKVGSSSILVMTSLAVSLPEQKKGGLSHQPIWRLLGTTMSKSSSLSVSLIEGKT